MFPGGGQPPKRVENSRTYADVTTPFTLSAPNRHQTLRALPKRSRTVQIINLQNTLQRTVTKQVFIKRLEFVTLLVHVTKISANAHRLYNKRLHFNIGIFIC